LCTPTQLKLHILAVLNLIKASIGIRVAETRLYGSPIASGPDAVHSIVCRYESSAHSIICNLGRISTGIHPYKIVIATNQTPQFALAIDAKNATIQESDVAEGKRSLILEIIQILVFGVVIIIAFTLIIDFIVKQRALTRSHHAVSAKRKLRRNQWNNLKLRLN